MKGKLFLLLGPSGVGKGTMEKMLKERHPEFCYPRSVTTRDPRPGEKAGDIYYFLKDTEFDSYIAEDKLLEWAVVHQKERYGTLKEEIVTALQAGRVVVREIEVQGWQKILATQPEVKSHLISIFILPPSLELLRQRIVQRAPISKDELERRLKSAQQEIEIGQAADYQVVSVQDKQEKVYQEIENIILRETDGFAV